MKQNWVALLSLALFAPPTGAAERPLATEKDRASYSLGVNMGREFRRQGIDFDLDLLVKGLKDGHSGAKLLVTEQELHKSLNLVQAEARRKLALLRSRPAENNRLQGQTFLNENRSKPGVVVLPSGLQYEVLKAGSDQKPRITDTVECRYRITHLDGKEIFATKAEKPATFPVKSAPVPAFSEALPLMGTGGKWRLFAPPSLAYGEAGVGSTVGPNETLIFELELVMVK